MRFLRDDLAEEVEGDLDEKFYHTLKSKSPLHAKLDYWYQVLNYIRPFALRKSARYPLNQYDMLQNYLKIGVRNLLKSKLFSTINITGMAISIASFLVISLFIYDEFRFDKHVTDVECKYRVYNERFSEDGTSRKEAMISPMIAPTLASDFPEVESYVRFLNFNNPVLFEVGEKKFAEDKGGLAEPTIFEMFSLKLLEGKAGSALREANTVAINKTLKEKYFGARPAEGETIEIFNRPYKVVAVFEDFSPYSHFQRNYFLAMEGAVRADRLQSWTWSQFHTYIQLKPGTDPAQLEAKLRDFAERHAWPETKPNGSHYIPHLMPLDQVHLQAHEQLWDVAVRGNAQTVYILSATAGFILFIAILNFINLSTARALDRVKEVGIRKTMGAFRKQLINQFISESMIIALVALVIGVGLAQLAIPVLNTFTEKTIPETMLWSPLSILALILFAFVMGTIAGAYPAFYISGYQPTEILSNRNGKSGKALLRKGLVVLQFMLSFFLIIASLTVSQQYTFMRNSDMGFDKNDLVVIRLRGDMYANLEATKQEFSNHGNIIRASLGYGLPGEAFAGDGIRDRQNNNKESGCSMLTVDHDYTRTLGLELVAGREFSRAFPSDEKEAFILTESAARMLGHNNPEEALGHKLAWPRWDHQDSVKTGQVIGVVKDIQLNSMRDDIRPAVIQIFPFAFNTLTMKVKPDHVPETIAHLEKTWKKFNNEWPFEFKFLDDNFDKLYKSEEKLASLFTFFTGFTIFVACLGLFGLVVYSNSHKYKEISIRKLLGAGEASIVVQLGKQYFVLLAVAFVMAAPLSYYAATQWLSKFPFRITVSPLLFVEAGLFILLISLATVGVQSFNAARANPVDALRRE